MPFRILVSNDDGHSSRGITALAEAMAELGEVWVVAPDREQSAASHAISLHRPLRINELRPRWYSVDGTPTDCSYLAINHLMKGARPDLMVSGINHGANLADDVTYSGTVAAAMEACLLGVPSIAFSLVARRSFDFTHAARFAKSLAASVLAAQPIERLLLNVNVPGNGEPKGYRVTRLGKHTYGSEVVENVDPRGRKYYWIGGSETQHEQIAGSDCNAVLDDQVISVTPLHLNLTKRDQMPVIAGWPLQGFAQVED
jgi:5'-nucleotidase